MKGLLLAVVMVFSFGAVSAWADSPGTPGPTMYTLEEIYAYIDYGTVATEGGHSFEPPSGATPGDTRGKTLKEVYELLEEQYSRSAGTTAAHVIIGHEFFCTNPGSWGVQTGTFVSPPCPTCPPCPTGTPCPTCPPTSTPIPTNTPTNTPTPTPPQEVQIASMWVAKFKEGDGCANNVWKVWQSALNWADGLIWLGHTNWRMPTKDESLSIANARAVLTYDTEFYWSSEQNTGNTATAWSTKYDTQQQNAYPKVWEFPVRAVRPYE